MGNCGHAGPAIVVGESQIGGTPNGAPINNGQESANMIELGRRGVFWFTDTLDKTQLIDLVQRCEQLRYSALWYPEVLSYECFSLGSFLLAVVLVGILAG